MKITIKGVPAYDGTYQLDYARLTNRDLHDIKRISGNLPLDIEDAAERGDMDLAVAFAVIALRKSGEQRINEDAIWDAELGAIKIEFDDDQEDEGPPTTGEPDEPTKPSGSASSSVSELRPANPPSATGTPSSDTPESASGTSAS
jgi:hypothetical protein